MKMNIVIVLLCLLFSNYALAAEIEVEMYGSLGNSTNATTGAVPMLNSTVGGNSTTVTASNATLNNNNTNIGIANNATKNTTTAVVVNTTTVAPVVANKTVVVVAPASNATNTTKNNTTTTNSTVPKKANVTKVTPKAEQPKVETPVVKKKKKNSTSTNTTKVRGLPTKMKVECEPGTENAFLPGDNGQVENVQSVVGYAVCKEFCKDAESEGLYNGTCVVDGELHRFPTKDGGALKQNKGPNTVKSPVPTTGTKTDMDFLPDTPPTEQVKSFWTEEGAKSLIMEDGKPRLPHARKGHTTSIIGNDLFVFGGCNAPAGKCYNQLLKLDLTKMEWSYPKVQGVAPPALSGHTATVVRLPPKDQWAAEDAVASVPFLFILGGKATTESADGKEMVYSDALYILSVKQDASGLPVLNWDKISLDQMMGPAKGKWTAREGHTATRVGSYLYVFGGQSDDGIVKNREILRMKILPDRERLKLDGKTFFQWTALDALKGAAPLARYGHSAGLLSGRYYTIFGGYVATKSGASNDVVAIDLGATDDVGNNCADAATAPGQECEWVKPMPMGTEPLPRQYAASTVIGKKGSRGNNKMVIFGGCGVPSKVCYNDAYVLRVTKQGWYWQQTDVDDDQIPERREAGTLTYIPSTVHFTSLANAFGPHVKMAKDGAAKNMFGSKNASRVAKGPVTTGSKHSLLEVESEDLNATIIGRKHGKRVILFGGTLRESRSFNDLFTFEMGQYRPEAIPEIKSDLPLTPAEKGCASNCSGHGRCDTGRCICKNETYGPWTGMNCSIAPIKPVPKKAAPAGFLLPQDSIIVSLTGKGCKANCSGHGECRNGTCVCHTSKFGHWHGPICNKLRCPNDCTGHGVCHNGTCACDKTYSGISCELRVCPGNKTMGVCSGHGKCNIIDEHKTKCACMKGWGGKSCFEKRNISECGALNCSYPNGRCINDTKINAFRCKCKKEWAGVECGEVAKFTHVISVNGKNMTVPSYVNDAKMVRVQINGTEKIIPIPNDPNQNITTVEHGVEKPAYVVGDELFTIPDATEDTYVEAAMEPAAPGATAVKVSCEGLKEFTPGDVMIFGAGNPATMEIRKVASVEMPAECAVPVNEHPCPTKTPGTPCSGNGECSGGECNCKANFGGIDCSTWACNDDPDCNHGTCKVANGTCTCEAGWKGEKCAVSANAKPANISTPLAFKATSQILRSQQPNTPPKAHLKVTCMKANGASQVLTADASQNKVEYALCEFFCADPSTPGIKFSGPCQIGTKRFSAGGTMVVDVGGMALIEMKTGGGGVALDRPLEFSHSGTIVKAVVAPEPEPVPTLEPKKACGIEGNRASGLCYTHGTCNDDTGKCACRFGWQQPYCEKSTCSSTCNTENGKCEWIDRLKRKHKRCFCKTGFGGDNCEKELCPGDCGGKYRGKCTEIPHNDTNGTYYFKNAKCVCKKGLGGEDCMTASGCGGSGHDCGSNGKCVADTCVCNAGWGGPLCNRQVCLHNCTGPEYGTCGVGPVDKSKPNGPSQRQCICRLGHKGADCSIPDPCGDSTGTICGGHGHCSSTSDGDGGRHCICNPGYGGEFCITKENHTCAMNHKTGELCGGPEKGMCVQKAVEEENCFSPPCCQCKFGFFGHDCTQNAPCPGNNCNGKGVCKKGLCECFPGWTGQACDVSSTCPMYGKTECAGHGECILGVCQCADGWEGYACHKAKGCPNNCTDAKHGACHGNRCHCMPGWEGADCSFSTKVNCPMGCSGHGICQVSTAKCYCEPGYMGPICAESVSCPKFDNKTCSGWGICKYGKCFCAPGREKYDDCRAPEECPRDASGNLCSGAGLCLNGTCFCAPGHYGDSCQRGKQCKNDCSRNGFCHNGKCQCDIAWYGDDCSVPVRCKGEIPDPSNPNSTLTCGGHGRCLRGRCYCGPGWMGDDCQTSMPCPSGCGVNGKCEGSVCICEPGWTGVNCTSQVDCEPKNCSGHGTCLLGQCQCLEGWSGSECNRAVPCPNDCSGHGDCVNGKCVCDFDYSGVDCGNGGHLKIEIFGPRCKNNCSNHGLCDGGKCLCNLEWTGEACEERLWCANNCSGHGMCHNGNCFCDPGYNGTSCHIYSGCLPGNGAPDCNDNGICSHGQCFCKPEWDGDACEKNKEHAEPTKCIIRNGVECGGHGICQLGQCICEKGWYGAACESILSKKMLLQQAPGATGTMATSFLDLGDKAKQLKAFSFRNLKAQLKSKNRRAQTSNCPNGCSGNGLCKNSACQCNTGYSGLDCAQMTQAKKTELEGVKQASDGSERFQSTGTGCHATCKSDRGTCVESKNEKSGQMEMKCKCKVGSMWTNGNDPLSCDKEECPKRCGMAADGVANGVCVLGVCKCDNGFGGNDCTHMCPQRCSGHGRCEMSGNDDKSYHCFCEAPWTGIACDQATHSNLMVSSMIAVAIITFIVGLCCIPLMKEYWEKREKDKYLAIVRGDNAIPRQDMRVQ